MRVKSLLFSCLVLAAQLAFAQGVDAPAGVAPEIPEDEFNRDSIGVVRSGDDALLIEAYAYLDTRDYPEFLELAEGLNISVLEIVTAAGTSLALPAQSLQLEPDAAAAVSGST